MAGSGGSVSDMLRREVAGMQEGVCQALAAAAVAELVVNRLFTRVGIFIPKQGIIADIYSALALISQPIFVATMLLAIIHGFLITILLARPGRFEHGQGILRLAGAAATGVVLMSVVILADRSPSLWGGLVFNGLIILSLTFLAALAPPRLFWLALAIVAASGSSLLAALLQTLGQIADNGPLTAVAVRLLALGELMLVGGSLPLVLSVGRRPLNAQVALMSALAGMLFCATYLAVPALVATMAIWTLGLTLYLPFPLYGLALALWLYALLSGRQSAGVLLLLSAGFGLAVSLHHLLLIGALYALAVAPEGTATEMPVQSLHTERRPLSA